MLTQEQSKWFRKRTWTEVDLDNLEHNVNTIRKTLSPNTKLMAMLKADAYGHGDYVMAPYLDSLDVDWLGVGELEEAVSFRNLGVTKPVFLCAPVMPEYAKTLAEYNLTVTVSSLEYARALNQYAKEAKVVVDMHLKIDTGMNRLGFPTWPIYWERSLKEIDEIYKNLTNVKVTGIYTHFAASDEIAEDKRDYQVHQHQLFVKAISELKERGYDVGLAHSSNSGATMNDFDYQFDMVRTGLIMYGYKPGDRDVHHLDVRPSMNFYSRIHYVKRVPPNTKVSYSLTYTTKRESLIATVAVGYADGYPRLLSNNSFLIYRGQKAPIIGNICMDQLMIDVTDIEKPQRGDVVTLVGTDEEETITWNDLGSRADTIGYEILCGVGHRVPRIYTQGGKDVDVLSYQNCIPDYPIELVQHDQRRLK